MDIVVVQLVEEDKWLKLTFKKLTLVKLHVKKLYSLLLKCTLLNYFSLTLTHE
jgi:hypothetical protein